MSTCRCCCHLRLGSMATSTSNVSSCVTLSDAPSWPPNPPFFSGWTFDLQKRHQLHVSEVITIQFAALAPGSFMIWSSGESSASAARQHSFDAWDPKLTSSQHQKRRQKRKQQQQQPQPAADTNLCNHWEVWLQSTYVASTLWSWTLCAFHDGRTWSCATGQQLVFLLGQAVCLWCFFPNSVSFGVFSHSKGLEAKWLVCFLAFFPANGFRLPKGAGKTWCSKCVKWWRTKVLN